MLRGLTTMLLALEKFADEPAKIVIQDYTAISGTQVRHLWYERLAASKVDNNSAVRATERQA